MIARISQHWEFSALFSISVLYALMFLPSSRVMVGKTSFGMQTQAPREEWPTFQKGYGVKATADIEEGGIILELPGLVGKQPVPENEPPGFQFSVMIVEDPFGGAGASHHLCGPLRFVNHDCHPNTEVSKISQSYLFHLSQPFQYILDKPSGLYYLRALTNISVGEELFTDYGLEYKQRCPCYTCQGSGGDASAVPNTFMPMPGKALSHSSN